MTIRANHPDYPIDRMLAEYKKCTDGRLKERYFPLPKAQSSYLVRYASFFSFPPF